MVGKKMPDHMSPFPLVIRTFAHLELTLTALFETLQVYIPSWSSDTCDTTKSLDVAPGISSSSFIHWNVELGSPSQSHDSDNRLPKDRVTDCGCTVTNGWHDGPEPQ